MMNQMIGAVLVAGAFLVVGGGCDPDGKKNCAWYLVPDLERANDTMREGAIPVCARNFENNKQDCRLQAPLDFAKDAFQKKFRFVDMEVDRSAYPGLVKAIEFCGK